ncbi:hypothetical protein [Streptomyces sp. NBC_00233]|uniref:hypothetical protein n=1 Tax=Streptomyces sp. NBC_00233 TaxID=2975686 RepID=UPI0022547E91|nr:hypothetical protein [Streptomyces sp. NBC_00233]MCX5232915.1 hypothetical protein [Streptomyces sp. NBC_00233]
MDETSGFIAGCPSTGKNPLPDDADAATWTGRLRRLVLEIEMREQDPTRIARSRYVAHANAQLLRERYADSPDLHRLLETTESRGPAVGVVLSQPLGGL